MNDIDVNRVLSQIRALQSQSAGLSRPAQPVEESGGFGRVMQSALDRVSLLQQTSADLQTKFERGEQGVDLVNVMLASSRAQVEFKGLVEVRNRLVRAYQDIMNMPL
jgi:flagellar hook-basal body complex protein FliE